MAPPIKIYGHYVSQPTRAVLWTLAIKNVPVEFEKINPISGEADSDAYYSKFPTGGAPGMEDRSDPSKPFFLSESNAILVYLAEKYGWNDLFPSADLHHRAKINQWLHWHHGNLRNCTTHIFRPAMLQVMGVPNKNAVSPKYIDRFMKDNMLVLTHEGKLKERPFLTGNTATLADIAAYCELDQLHYGRLFDFTPHPVVMDWMKRMQAMPHHDDIRRSLFKLVENIKQQTATKGDSQSKM